MECRKGCAACCIFVDILTPIPQHPEGKPFGERCKNLDKDDGCTLHGTKDYPKLCAAFQAEKEFCGDTKEEAKAILSSLMPD